MKAQYLRTVWLQGDDPVVLKTVVDRFMNGGALTAAETGVVDEDTIKGLELVGQPDWKFDGFFWNVFIFVTQG